MKMMMGVMGIAAVFIFLGASRQGEPSALSFKKDVFPIIDRYCLPCHDEDSFNPSDLSLDTYDLMMQGGKHGSPVAAGKPDESLLIKKLSSDPPFGKQMPVFRKNAPADQPQKRPSEKEIQTLRDWIAQGAPNN